MDHGVHLEWTLGGNTVSSLQSKHQNKCKQNVCYWRAYALEEILEDVSRTELATPRCGGGSRGGGGGWCGGRHRQGHTI